MKSASSKPPGEYVLLKEDPQEIEDPSAHDIVVLEALGGSFEGEDNGSISFQGIKRRLGLHQETLSRALHRLERDGYVVKNEKEYALSAKGEAAISRHSVPVAPRQDSYSIPILRTLLPAEFDVHALISSISHKWFGNLRWFGSSTSAGGTILAWITPDGKMKLKARISEGYLSIESEAISAQGKSEAVAAAYEIFHHISLALKQQPPISLRPESFRAA